MRPKTQRWAVLVGLASISALACGDDGQVVGERQSGGAAGTGQAGANAGGSSSGGTAGGSAGASSGGASGSTSAGGAGGSSGGVGGSGVGGSSGSGTGGSSAGGSSGSSAGGSSGSGAGGSSGNAGSAGTAGTGGSTLCGGVECAEGYFCCGPPECGWCAFEGSDPGCKTSCDDLGGDCGTGCTRGEPGVFCLENQVTWECSPTYLVDLMQNNCQDAGTGLIRYCCPPEFLSVCVN